MVCNSKNEQFHFCYICFLIQNATEAVSACIDELFRIGLQKVTAGFFEENNASRRVMEKCGMHKLKKEDDIEYGGILHHCLYYGIENPN